jgi:hypothetical protein
MREFGWSERHIMFGITGAKGWHYYSWSRENCGSAFQSPQERVGGGLIQEEKKKILKRYGK